MTVSYPSTWKIFIDTNIIVYATVSTSSFYGEARQRLIDLRNAGHELWISRQVLREYCVVVTRSGSFPQPMTTEMATKRVELFQRLFWVADETQQVTAHLIALLKQFPTSGKQIHDANIVATMQANGLTHLLTQNISDFNRFQSVVTLLSVK